MSFEIKNPMCIRLSEERAPAEPTEHYRKDNEDSYNRAVKVFKNGKEISIYNSVAEAADFFDTENSRILTALAKNQTLYGMKFEWLSTQPEV